MPLFTISKPRKCIPKIRTITYIVCFYHKPQHCYFT